MINILCVYLKAERNPIFYGKKYLNEEPKNKKEKKKKDLIIFEETGI